MKILAALLAFLPLAACGVPEIRTAGVAELVVVVVERTDSYVTVDPLLSTTARDQAFLESATLAGLVTTREVVPAEPFRLALEPVAVRHDRYVSADAELNEVERRRALRSTAILRDVAAAAAVGGGP